MEIIHSISSIGSGTQLAVNEIEDDRKQDVLLCYCDEAVFMILSSEIKKEKKFA